MRGRLRFAVVAVATSLALLAGSCGTDGDVTSSTTITAASSTSAPTTAAPTTTTTTTLAPTTTVALTTTGPATSQPATTAPATTTAPCPPLGGTTEQSDGFPERYSAMVGQDLRIGRHACFERVVVELAGTGNLPGWRVHLIEGPPVLDPLGEPATMLGNAFLEITVNVWMPDPFDNRGYQGPAEIFPKGYEAFLELERTENFEGQSTWAVGLDKARPFEVTMLSDPVRLVVDVAVP